MSGLSLGFIVGLMVAAVLIYFLFRYANKDGKVKTEYDERQKAVRGKAYKYSFYTTVFAQAALMWVFMSGIELPIENYVLVFISLILGCIVLAAYCIWNDVYWGLNNDRRKYHIIFIIAIILNCLPVAGAVAEGTFYENGKLGMPMLNVIVLAMMVIVYALLIIKSIRDKNDNVED